MTVLAVLFAIVLVLVVSVATARRRRGTEAHSVAGYRRTLDTLAGLGAHRPSGTGRLLGGRANPPRPSPHTSEVSAERLGRPPSALDPRWRAGGSRFPIGLAVAATAVLLVVVVVALVLAHGHRSKANGASATASTVAGSHRHHGSTTTSLSSPEQPLTSTATSATYVPPTSTYSLTLAATTGNCWVQVTDASGATVLAQTLAAGTSHAVTLSGRVSVLLGAPTVAAVTVDRVPAVLPTGYGSPFTMTFAPSSAGAGG